MSDLQSPAISEGEASVPSSHGTVMGAEGVDVTQHLSSQTVTVAGETFNPSGTPDMEVVFRDQHSAASAPLKPEADMDLIRPPPPYGFAGMSHGVPTETDCTDYDDYETDSATEPTETEAEEEMGMSGQHMPTQSMFPSLSSSAPSSLGVRASQQPPPLMRHFSTPRDEHALTAHQVTFGEDLTPISSQRDPGIVGMQGADQLAMEELRLQAVNSAIHAHYPDGQKLSIPSYPSSVPPPDSYPGSNVNQGARHKVQTSRVWWPGTEDGTPTSHPSQEVRHELQKGQTGPRQPTPLPQRPRTPPGEYLRPQYHVPDAPAPAFKVHSDPTPKSKITHRAVTCQTVLSSIPSKEMVRLNVKKGAKSASKGSKTKGGAVPNAGRHYSPKRSNRKTETASLCGMPDGSWSHLAQDGSQMTPGQVECPTKVPASQPQRQYPNWREPVNVNPNPQPYNRQGYVAEGFAPQLPSGGVPEHLSYARAQIRQTGQAASHAGPTQNVQPYGYGGEGTYYGYWHEPGATGYPLNREGPNTIAQGQYPQPVPRGSLPGVETFMGGMGPGNQSDVKSYYPCPDGKNCGTPPDLKLEKKGYQYEPSEPSSPSSSSSEYDSAQESDDSSAIRKEMKARRRMRFTPRDIERLEERDTRFDKPYLPYSVYQRSDSESSSDSDNSGDSGYGRSPRKRSSKKHRRRHRYAPRRKEMDPPLFDGDANHNILDYLLQFQITAEYNRWSLRETGRRLAGSLRKDACEVLSILGRKRAQNYHALVKALMKRFCPSGLESKFAIELMSKKYNKRKESLPQFAQSLQKLAKRAYPDSHISQRQLCDIFARALPRDMRKQIQLMRPRTLEDSVVIALTCEAIDDASDLDKPRKPKVETANAVQEPQSEPKVKKGKRSRKGRKKSSSDTEGSVATVALTNDSQVMQMLKTMNDKFDQQAAEIEALKKRLQRKPRSEVTCHTCGVKGHYKWECKSDQAQNQDSQSQSYYQSNLSAQSQPFRPQRQNSQSVSMVEENWDMSGN